MTPSARTLPSHLAAFAFAFALAAACGDDGTTPDLAMPDAAVVPDAAAVADLVMPDLVPDTSMSFFISSRRGSGNLGGLAGADMLCSNLATAAGVTGKTWRAYLSAYADGGQPAVNARDRIGKGPWYNAKGVKIASDVADLHNNMMMGLVKTAGLDEKGMQVPGRGDMPNEHDILTGSKADGTVNAMSTCKNWTSEETMGTNATVGHFDRMGGGADPTSWNSAHNSQGCSAAQLIATGGAGRIYCFAVQ